MCQVASDMVPRVEYESAMESIELLKSELVAQVQNEAKLETKSESANVHAETMTEKIVSNAKCIYWYLIFNNY